MPRSPNSKVFVWRGKHKLDQGGRLIATPVQDNTRIKVDDRTYWLVRRLANRESCTMRRAMEIVARGLK